VAAEAAAAAAAEPHHTGMSMTRSNTTPDTHQCDPLPAALPQPLLFKHIKATKSLPL
jgi:hypothetical protein